MFSLENSADWRYERKFFISEFTKQDVEDVIKFHPAMFSEIFEQRCVNNIYLDTYDHTNFFKNVDGQSQRLKVRVRWYGDLFGEVKKPILEFKIKNGQLGRKVSFELPDFDLSENLSDAGLHNIFNKSGIPDGVKSFLSGFSFTLVNCYTRKYFQTADKNYRVTIDSNMQYFKLISHQFNNFVSKFVDRNNVILELKYREEYDTNADAITNNLPFRMTKSSKYVTGLENFLTAIS